MNHIFNRAPRADRRRPRTWMPRVWMGASLGVLLRLLARHHFAVGIRYWYIAAFDVMVAPVNSILGLVERVVYGRRIRRQAIAEPIIVVGHWRCGSTLLHELLALDACHAFPTAYDACAPHHCVLTRRWLPRLLRFLLPDKRPMDDMPIGFGSPFEEEFALCLLGARSPYEAIAFPNHGGMQREQFDPDEFPPTERARWRATLLRFLQKVSLCHPGLRLVLKSPPHTCRIRTILDMFPDARIVQVVRNPYEVYASTLKLWQTLYRKQGLQSSTFAGLEEMVLDIGLYLHDCLERDRHLIAENRFGTVRFEDLLHNPVGEMRPLYAKLELGDFESVRPAIERYFADRVEYRQNRHELSAETRHMIHVRWERLFQKWGYEPG